MYSRLISNSSGIAAIVSVILLVLTIYHDFTVKKMVKELK
jgi:hypothetical protein